MDSQSIPYRQIRAHYTSNTITVYQAYNKDIASAAVEHQKLDASPKFSSTRMTWIKPSWAWILYRSGYSYKDPGQERILALNLTHSAFIELLRSAIVASHAVESGVKAQKATKSTKPNVRVQWDPERTLKLDKLPYRSIQIGVPGAAVSLLVAGIVKIEDVTERARTVKRMLDEDDQLDTAELAAAGLAPEERAFEVDEELRKTLMMD